MKPQEFNDEMDLLAYNLEELIYLLKTHNLNGNKDAMSLHWLMIEITDKLIIHCMHRMKDKEQRIDYLDTLIEGIDNFKKFRVDEGL